MYLPIGTELKERYIIEGILGHGGFGITYAAQDTLLNIKVAIKEYLPRQMSTRGEGQAVVSVFTGEARENYLHGLRKFLQEAQAVAKFSNHPNIVSCRDYFEANNTAYLVMDHLQGLTLKEYLQQQGGKIPFALALSIMTPVMDALGEIHAAGLLHRDISPDNIFLTVNNQVKVLDFGAARQFTGEQSKSLSVILKSGYAPEEQYRSSGKQGAWTDVYAAAATLYRTITGQTPPDALDRLAEDTLVAPSRLGVALAPGVEQGLLRALAVSASQRLQSMAELRQALQGASEVTVQFQPTASPPGVATPPHFSAPRPQKTRRTTTYIAIASGLAVAIFLGVGLYSGQVLRQGPSPGPAPAPQKAAQQPPAPPQTAAPAVAEPAMPPVPPIPPVSAVAPPSAPEPLGQFQVGSKWLIDWQSQFRYRGYLQIQRQLDANRYFGRISVTFSNSRNVRATVSMDGLVTVRGQEVVINCSNASESWWDTDDFYLQRQNGTLTGYNLDKKGRRGRAVFTLVDEARFAAFLRQEFQPEKLPEMQPAREAGTDQMQIQQVIREYYDRVARRNVDGAIGMYATPRIPAIKRHLIEAVARVTEYYRFATIEVYQNNGQEAKAQVQLFHKKFNQPEEKWVIDIQMLKESGSWKIWATPGKRVS
jgi:serine/threonine protein kinase